MAKRSEQQKQRYLQIVEQYSTLIYKVCYMYADDAEHLKDLRQEVLANLWQGLEGYNGNSRMSTWIYRVAINTCITFFRRHGKHPFPNDKHTLALTIPLWSGLHEKCPP